MWERLKPSNSTTIRHETGSIPQPLFHSVQKIYASFFFAFFRFWIRHEKPDEFHRFASSEIILGLRRSLFHEVRQKKMVPTLGILPSYTEVVFFFNILDYSVVGFVLVGKWRR
jgi:hypothetical protein